MDVTPKSMKIVGRMSLPQIRELYERMRNEGMGGIRAKASLLVEAAQAWVAAGCPRFRLTETMTALLAMSSAPDLDIERMPYPAFSIEFPSSYVTDRRGHGGIFLVVSRMRDGAGVVAVGGNRHSDLVLSSNADGTFRGESGESFNGNELAMERISKIERRIIAGLIAYVTEYREAPKKSQVSKDRLFRVDAPAEIEEATRTQIRNAARLATDGGYTFTATKLSLRHVVRGHWKNQPAGAARQDRRRIWVMPYIRGEDSVGRVGERIIRVLH